MATTSMKDRTLSGVGNLIKLLPTGTVFLFQFLNPVVTNSGNCSSAFNKYLTAALIGFCGLSCFLSSFTDSYVDEVDGTTHYGFATRTGLWPVPPPDAGVDAAKYRLHVGDFVHAVFTAVVFAAVALLDDNTVECFYPSFESNDKVLMMVVPPVIGAVSGTIFMVFPTTRHGIGYPSPSPAPAKGKK